MRQAARSTRSSKALLWATKGSPSTHGTISLHTASNVGAPQVSAVYLFGKTADIVIGVGTNQPMHALRYFPATNDHKPHGTNTRRLVIGGFEIYGDKIFHAIILRVKIRKKQDYRIIEISSCKFCHA